MASRTFHDIQTHRDIIAVPFTFAPNGSSAVVQSSIKGLKRGIASITRTGTGAFNVVFEDSYYDFVGFAPSVHLNALADTDVQGGPFTAATKTMVLNVKTAGVAADIAANTNNRIGGVAFFAQSAAG